MSFYCELVIGAGSSQGEAVLTLHLGQEHPISRSVDLRDIPFSLQCGLLDLRRYVETYREPHQEAEAMVDVGRCISETLLGPEIFGRLNTLAFPATLAIRHHRSADGSGDGLLPALLQVPWELARSDAGSPSLAELGLNVVATIGESSLPSDDHPVCEDDTLRILFVFAETSDSRPLSARRERRDLMRLIREEIAPNREVAAHFLYHGVTLEKLRQHLATEPGYHILHWSGHGRQGALEVAGRNGSSILMGGRSLLEVLAAATPILPRLVFLSACDSGTIVDVRDWNQFLTLASGNKEIPKPQDGSWLLTRSGHIGVSQVLSQAGIPAVLAMRFAVGDEFAREFAIGFYRALLADGGARSVGEATAMARSRLPTAAKDQPGAFLPCDHVTPLLFGGHGGFPAGGGGAGTFENNRLDPFPDFQPEKHFVGRHQELRDLEKHVFGPGAVRSVAVISGLGGMGKTALARELLDEWRARFNIVHVHRTLTPTSPEHLLKELRSTMITGGAADNGLRLSLPPEDPDQQPPPHAHVGEDALGSVEELLWLLRNNRILLIIDNFETNLVERSPPPALASWPSADPRWDAFLAALPTELGNSSSRVVITSRRRPAALPDSGVFGLTLGCLSPRDAALYLRERPGVKELYFSGDGENRKLAIRVMRASRFHPLLLDRLARLAAVPALRDNLYSCLASIETGSVHASLPDLLADWAPGLEESTAETRYLEDALLGTIDLMIGWSTPDARLLLWIITRATHAMPEHLLQSLWTDLKHGSNFPADGLLAVGLVSRGAHSFAGDSESLSAHELVRERIDHWMGAHPDELTGRAERDVRVLLGGKLESEFLRLKEKKLQHALNFGIRALVQYAEAGAFEHISRFADEVIISTREPAILRSLVPLLEMSVASGMTGKAGWDCVSSLGNMLRNIGQLEESIPFYEHSKNLMTTALASSDSKAVWADLARLNNSMGIVLRRISRTREARQCYEQALEAARRAERPPLYAATYQMELYRLDILDGGAGRVADEVHNLLARMRDWWTRFMRNGAIEEAPDPDYLESAWIGALDVAQELSSALGRQEEAFGYVEETLRVRIKRNHPPYNVAIDRYNLAMLWIKARVHLEKAEGELEECLKLFHSKPEWILKVHACMAELLATKGDLPEAISQQRRALSMACALPDIAERGRVLLNLATYLKAMEDETSRQEAALYQFAALVYLHVAAVERLLSPCLGEYATDHIADMESGSTRETTDLAVLLRDKRFRHLDQWLEQHQVDRTTLREEILDRIRFARQVAEQLAADHIGS